MNEYINLELYRIFKVVAETGNITKASQILHISQPAVTKQINNLESILNKSLFNRSKTGTTLNEDGEKLYNQIKDPINILINASSVLNYENRLQLGIHINMPKRVYDYIVLDYYKKYEDSIINIHLLAAEAMFNELETGKLDLAFSKKYDESIHSQDIKFIKLGEFEDAFIVNSNSKFINISKEELKQEDIYTLKNFSKSYFNLVNTLEYKDYELNKIKHVNFSSILDLLNTKDIIAYITKEYVNDYLEDNIFKILNIESDNNKEEFGLYYNTRNNNDNVQRLINFFKENIHN